MQYNMSTSNYNRFPFMKTIFYLFLLSLLLAVCYFYPFSFHLGNSVVNVIDPLFYAWNLSHNAATIAAGEFRTLLNTNIYFPLTNTLAFSDTLFSQTIAAAPIIWITKNPILAENISLLLTFPLASLSMFFLSYWFTKDILASSISGLFYAFSYPRIAQLGHLPTLSSQYLPLCVLFLLKYLETGTRAAAIALLCFLLLTIGSGIYFAVFLFPMIICACLIYLVYWIKNKQASICLQRVKTITPYLIPFSLFVLFLIYPYILLKIENPEIKRNIFDTMHLRAFPIDYLQVLPTSILTRFGFPIGSPEHALYPTITLFILAVAGIIIAWKKRKLYTIILICWACIAFILSFGTEQYGIRLPYYYLYQWIPLFQIVRVPARFSIFFILSLSVLASFALASIESRLRRIYIIIICLFLVETVQINIPFTRIPIKDTIPPVYQWLAQQKSETIIAEVPFRRFYMGNPMEQQLMKPYQSLNEKDNYAIETYRVYFSSFHKKRIINGYSGFFPTEYNTISELAESFPSQIFLNVIKERGVHYLIVHAWQFDKPWIELSNDIAQFLQLHLVKQFENDYVYTIDTP